MPADLDDTTGQPALLSVGETPWHKEGVVLTEPPSIDDALRLAKLDFQVALDPVFVQAKVGRGYDRAPDYQAVRRTDVGTILGIVRAHYTPLQNRDAFRIIEPLLEQGVAHIETAGALRGGRDVWVLVRFVVQDPVVQEVFAEEVVPFGLVSNNHAGERRVLVQETPIRVVCSNTLAMAHSGPGRRVGIRHTIDVEARTVDAARQLWGTVIERYRTIADQYRRLMATYLDEAMFRKLVLDNTAPIRPELNAADLTKSQQQARERAERRRDRIRHLWLNGKGHRGDHSSWEAYNAVAQTVDHDASLWPTKGKRTAALFDGQLARTKQRVLSALMEQCE